MPPKYNQIKKLLEEHAKTKFSEKPNVDNKILEEFVGKVFSLIPEAELVDSAYSLPERYTLAYKLASDELKRIEDTEKMSRSFSKTKDRKEDEEKEGQNENTEDEPKEEKEEKPIQKNEKTNYNGVAINTSKTGSIVSKNLNNKSQKYLGDLNNVENSIADSKFIAELKATGKLPQNASGQEVVMALKLHSMGVSSVDFIQKTYDNTGLLSQHKEQLFTAGIIMSALEDTNSNEFNNVREYFQNPEVNIQTYSIQPPTSPSQISMSNDMQDVLSFVTDEAKGKGVEFLKGKAKKYVSEALKKGWGKVGEALKTKAIEESAKTAAAAAVEATATAATAPTVIGPVIVLVGSALLALGKKTIGKGLELITGEKKFSKQIRDLAIIGGGITLLSGLPVVGIPLLVFGIVPGIVGVSVGSRIVGAFTTVAGVAMFLLKTAVVSLLTNIVLAAVISVLSIVLIYTIINMSAYVVPPGGFGTKTEMMAKGEYFPREGGEDSNPYLSVNKSVDVNSVEIDFEGNVTYTLTICASITDIQITSIDCDCTVYGETDLVPGYETATCSLGESFEGGVGIVIPANTCQTFTFTEFLYGGAYIDTAIVNKCCVTGVADDESWTNCGTASLTVGEPPFDCPEGSPMQCINGECPTVAQWPGDSYSHDSVEAVDLNVGWGDHDCGWPVVATHGGIAHIRYSSQPGYGNYIDIESVCNGVTFYSRYAHLGTINVTEGQAIVEGMQIGTVGDSGTDNCHLHYEFRKCLAVYGCGYLCPNGDTDLNGLPCMLGYFSLP